MNKEKLEEILKAIKNIEVGEKDNEYAKVLLTLIPILEAILEP